MNEKKRPAIHRIRAGDNWKRLAHWFLPNGGTILLLALFLTGIVGAGSEMDPRAQLESVLFPEKGIKIPDGSITTEKLADESVTEEKIADAAIATAHIQDSAVIMEKIADGAVTQYQAVTGSMVASTSSTMMEDIPTLSITLETTGGPVLLMFSGSHRPSSYVVTAYFQIIRDDAVVLAYNNQAFHSMYAWTTTTLIGIDVPPPGEHTYKVQWRISHSGETLHASEGVYSENFVAIELKK